MIKYSLALLLLTSGCKRAGEDGFSGLPESWKVTSTLSGSAERGFGAAVAWHGDQPRIGEPWHGPGRVHGADGVLLEGTDGDRLGEALLGGADLYIGSPGRGDGGAILKGTSGDVLYEGAAGEGLGGALAWHEGEILATTTRGFRANFGTFRLTQRIWSVVVARPAGPAGSPEILLGLAAGGFGQMNEVGGDAVGGSLGRSLLACDVDRDGDDDIVAGDPILGEVRVYVWDGSAVLDPATPTMTHTLGPGAGFSLACVRGGVLVGAADRAGGGGVAWLANVLSDRPPVWLDGEAGGKLGHSLAVGPGMVLAGDPGRGQAHILSARR